MDTSQAPHSETAQPAGSNTPQPAAKPSGSPLRLGVLLLVLAACIGALVFDYQFAKPGSEVANEKIKAFVEGRNRMAVKDAGPVTSADIQKEIGRSPTWVKDEPTHTVEWYCWWGPTPLLSSRRHFITVVYVGENRRFSSHTLNGPPAPDELPTHFLVDPDDVQPLADPSGAPAGGAGQPPGVPPGIPSNLPPGAGGKAKGKGKGKGRPEKPMPPSSEQESADEPVPGKPASETTEKPAEEGEKPAEASDDKPAAGESPEADKPAAEKPATEKESDVEPAPPATSDAP